METVKKLNEKVYDLSEENIFLRKQIEDLVKHIQSIDKSGDGEEEGNYTNTGMGIQEEYKTLESRVEDLEKELSKIWK